MSNRCMNVMVVLTVVLISLVSISFAAGPRAMPDLYTTGQCGVELSVPAPGILGNDVKSTNPLQVKDPEKITIDTKYGTLKVNADGSFVYDAAKNFPTSATISFSYSATDGTTVTSPALVKISVSCQCHGAAPDITVCLGTVVITPEYLMSMGAGCTGCRDATPKFDLSKIPAQPVAGATYPYTVSCPACSLITGHVTFVGPCDVSWNPYTVCAGVTPLPGEILVNGRVTCSCDVSPVISNIQIVGDHWEYAITCQSVCGPKTVVGRVFIETPCVPTSTPFTVCSGVIPTAAQIMANGVVSCGACDATPAISGIHIDGDHWEYTITCTTALGCTKTATGRVNIELVCVPTSTPFTICSGVTPTAAMIQASGSVTCGTGVCDSTPVISSVHLAGDHWEYTITCTTALGCSATATGRVNIETVCVPTSEAFTVCPDVTPTADQILANGVVSCGECDATPAISGIHIDGDHWVYTITCTTALGCTATGTGIVNIGQPCVIDFIVFPIPTDNCPGNVLPTAAQIMDLGAVDCGCDATPVISNIHWVSTPPDGEWTGEYTITCTSADGCTSTTTGQFNNAVCQEKCCAPKAPDLCSCVGFGFPNKLFTELGGGCGSGCDATTVIDDSQVDYTKSGSTVYPYAVTCLGCFNSEVATGRIYIDNPTCGGPNNADCVCGCCD